MKRFVFAASVAAICVSSTALAGPNTQSGSSGGLSWTATNRVIGQSATSDVLPPSNTIGGGNPIYKPSADKSGTVALIMESAAKTHFIPERTGRHGSSTLDPGRNSRAEETWRAVLAFLDRTIS